MKKHTQNRLMAHFHIGIVIRLDAEKHQQEVAEEKKEHYIDLHSRIVQPKVHHTTAK